MVPLDMEVARFALAAMAATLLLSSTLFEFTSSAPSFISPTVMPEDGSGGQLSECIYVCNNVCIVCINVVECGSK